MPVMNGYDLTRAIRAHEQEQGLEPCIVLGFTANAQPEEKQRCREAGMDDCLFKPISLSALNDRLSRVGVRERRPGQQPDKAPFEMSSIVALTGDRPEMIQHLIDQLIISCRDDAAELAQVNARGDRGEIHDMAHKIKGAAKIIRASEVIDLCGQLERACDDDADDEVVRHLSRSLEEAVAALQEALLRHQQG